MKRIAVIGDCHACIIELKELYSHLQWLSLDEIWTVGDMVDRGPDSAAVIEFCIEKNIKAILGNHDDVIVGHWDRVKKENFYPKNKDKQITLKQLNDTHINWLRTLPTLHVMDSENLILVHGGVWPNIPLYKQPHNVLRAQMIKPELIGATRWWGKSATKSEVGKTEEQSRLEGWERWYKLFDYEHNIIYGHSCFSQPFIHRNPGCGMTIGVDTGSCFGGSLTACIYENGKEPYFIAVKAKKIWYEDTYRSFWEED